MERPLIYNFVPRSKVRIRKGLRVISLKPWKISKWKLKISTSGQVKILHLWTDFYEITFVRKAMSSAMFHCWKLFSVSGDVFFLNQKQKIFNWKFKILKISRNSKFQSIVSQKYALDLASECLSLSLEPKNSISERLDTINSKPLKIEKRVCFCDKGGFRYLWTDLGGFDASWREIGWKKYPYMCKFSQFLIGSELWILMMQKTSNFKSAKNLTSHPVVIYFRITTKNSPGYVLTRPNNFASMKKCASSYPSLWDVSLLGIFPRE